MAQKTIVVGHIGSVQPLKSFNGNSVLNFGIASSDYAGKGADGKGIYKTTWFSCSKWGQTAESIASAVNAGDLWMVEGKLDSDENGNPKVYEAKNGEHRASFNLVVSDVQLIKKGSGAKSSEYDEDETDETEETDDLPF